MDHTNIFLFVGLIIGFIGLLIPRSTMRRNSTSRKSTVSWFKILGAQHNLFIGRFILGNIFFFSMIKLIQVYTVLETHIFINITISVLLGLISSAYLTLKFEWIGQYIKYHGTSLIDKIFKFTSVLSPKNSPLPSHDQLSDQPERYCSLDSERSYPNSKWGEPIFEENSEFRKGPISFGPDKFSMIGYTIINGQLISFSISGDVRLNFNSLSDEWTQDHSYWSSDPDNESLDERSAVLSEVKISSNSYEKIAEKIHKNVSSEVNSIIEKDIQNRSTSITIPLEDTKIELNCDREVGEIKLTDVRFTLSSYPPLYIGCLTKETIYKDLDSKQHMMKRTSL